MSKVKFPSGVTPLAVASYPHLTKPDTEGKFADNKFKVTLLFDKTDDMSGLEKLVKDAATLKWGEVPADLKMPWRDGDTVKKADGTLREEWAGKFVLGTKSKFQPTLIGADRKALPDDVWPSGGDLIKVKVETYPYEKKETVHVKDADGNMTEEEMVIHAVSLQLQTVQLLEKRAMGSGGSGGVDGFDDESDTYGIPNAPTPSAESSADSAASDDGDPDFAL